MKRAGGRERMIQSEALVENEQIKCKKEKEQRFRNCWRKEKCVSGKGDRKGWIHLHKKR